MRLQPFYVFVGAALLSSFCAASEETSAQIEFPTVQLVGAQASESDGRSCGGLARRMWNRYEEDGLLGNSALSLKDATETPLTVSESRPRNRIPAFLRESD